MNSKDCPFCETDQEIILDSELCFSIYDQYPVNKGHILVIPKRHLGDYFQLKHMKLIAYGIWMIQPEA